MGMNFVFVRDNTEIIPAFGRLGKRFQLTDLSTRLIKLDTLFVLAAMNAKSKAELSADRIGFIDRIFMAGKSFACTAVSCQ